MCKSSNSWRKSTAAFLALALLVAALAACGAPAPAAPAPTTAVAPAAGTAATAVPKPEGVLRVSISSLAKEVLDPYVDPGSGDALLNFFFDHLVGAAPDGMSVGTAGGIATKWEQKPDASGWTFYLRQGVQWDKGYGEVTAEDVKYSLERSLFREGANSADATAIKAGVAEIVVVGPYTLRIDTKSPFLDLPYLISRLNMSNGAIVPKKAIEQLGEAQYQRNPVSSGPYRMVKHEPGSYFKFEAQEDYWGGVPRYKEVYVYGVPEDTTRVAMLKRGELDVAEVTIPQLKELEAAGFRTVEKKDSMVFRGFTHNQWEGALAKKDVRQALNMAVNAKELADKLFEGRAQPTYGKTPSYLLGGKDLPAVPYDPVQAKRLLAQAGYPSGFDLTVLATPQTPLPLLSEALVGYFRAVGINATVKSVDDGTRASLWRSGTLKDTITPYNSSNRAFFLSGWMSSHSAKGAVTVVRDSDPKLESLLQTAAKSRTLEELAEGQGKIQQYIRDQYLDLFLLHAGRWFAASPKLNIEGWNGGGMAARNIGLRELTIR